MKRILRKKHVPAGRARRELIQALRETARRLWQDEGVVEVDENAKVSADTDILDAGGAYVQAWVWVSLEEAERCPNCGDASPSGGDGWDGLCGTCADRAERESA